MLSNLFIASATDSDSSPKVIRLINFALTASWSNISTSGFWTLFKFGVAEKLTTFVKKVLDIESRLLVAMWHSSFIKYIFSLILQKAYFQ